MSTTNGSQGVVTTAEGVGYDQLVQVSSSNPALAAVPPSVTVFAVSGIGFFDITTAPVTTPTTVTISVSGGGVTLSHPLTIYPTLPLLTALTVSPDSVAGGSPATGTVTLAERRAGRRGERQPRQQPPLDRARAGERHRSRRRHQRELHGDDVPHSTPRPALRPLDNAFEFASITVNESAPPPPRSRRPPSNPSTCRRQFLDRPVRTSTGPAPSGERSCRSPTTRRPSPPVERHRARRRLEREASPSPRPRSPPPPPPPSPPARRRDANGLPGA